MNELATLLAGIEQRPGMWIGSSSRSLRDLRIFLSGYNQGRPRGDESGQPFDYFTPWVAAHYQTSTGPRDSFRLILEHVGGDDQLAFDEFFRLWPLYQRDRVEHGVEWITARYASLSELFRSP